MAFAVDRTTVSPRRTRTAPSDCLAIRPVSIERVYLPRGISTRCIAISFLSAPLGIPPMGTPCPAGAVQALRSGFVSGDLLWWGGSEGPSVLLADAQPLDEAPIPVRVLALHVVEEAAPLPDQLQKPAARMMVLRVGLEMLGQVVDPLAQDGDLDFGRARVGTVGLVARDYGRLGLFTERHRLTSSMSLLSKRRS